MNILVLGGYGLIGREIVRLLLRDGHRVAAAGRSVETGQRLLPEARWFAADLNHMTRPEDWRAHLANIDAVINASGALQTGARDDLGRVQRDSIVALIRACEAQGVTTFVQISAPGAAPSARTEFLATKGEADTALRESRLRWVILKPGLVIAPTAYGGTSLLRTLAAFPWILPIVYGRARLQIVAVADVAEAAARAVADTSLGHRDFDLVAREPRTLTEITLAFRRWMGFAPPRFVVELPALVGGAVAALADAAGWLGWRPPLRTTSMKVLADDVTGDPAPWREATGRELPDLDDTLAAMPATRQERQYARTQLLFPVSVVLFALFWLASGLIGLWQLNAAAALIAPQVGAGPAKLAVIGGAFLDALIAGGLLVRRTFQAACIAAIIVSIAYLGLGTVLVPDLWADPLGPFVKIFPVIAVAALLHAMAGDR